MADVSQPTWFKSSYSGGSGTECVECAFAEHDTLVRDSKNREGSVIRVDHSSWTSFVQEIRRK
ncbi:DUF397 domain-containing protein [Streptomyces sp. CHD11]|uniref:DUF397 domain-containing protein n=1 Tax=Streptomyces sp. CHD11 TaxID=2741325 RepID=UPI001BFC865A|nr:DUF397 domain-containing protein [Streptomyces sp. CHD11]MBT3151005.1 DUF397 domain-containing protein [Streptomyces sp. CHD11]